MIYNNIILIGALLLTGLPLHSHVNNEDRIQELEEILREKMFVLSELGAKIDEKQKLLDSIFKDMCSFTSDCIAKLNLEGEERKTFIDQSSKMYEEFYTKLQAAIVVNKTVKGFLTKELLNEEKSYPDYLEVQKIWELRALMEQAIIKIFVEQYEECLQEMIQLGDELKRLKNNSQ